MQKMFSVPSTRKSIHQTSAVPRTVRRSGVALAAAGLLGLAAFGGAGCSSGSGTDEVATSQVDAPAETTSATPTGTDPASTTPPTNQAPAAGTVVDSVPAEPLTTDVPVTVLVDPETATEYAELALVVVAGAADEADEFQELVGNVLAQESAAIDELEDINESLDTLEGAASAALHYIDTYADNFALISEQLEGITTSLDGLLAEIEVAQATFGGYEAQGQATADEVAAAAGGLQDQITVLQDQITGSIDSFETPAPGSPDRPTISRP